MRQLALISTLFSVGVAMVFIVADTPPAVLAMPAEAREWIIAVVTSWAIIGVCVGMEIERYFAHD